MKKATLGIKIYRKGAKVAKGRREEELRVMGGTPE